MKLFVAGEAIVVMPGRLARKSQEVQPQKKRRIEKGIWASKNDAGNLAGAIGGKCKNIH